MPLGAAHLHVRFHPMRNLNCLVSVILGSVLPSAAAEGIALGVPNLGGFSWILGIIVASLFTLRTFFALFITIPLGLFLATSGGPKSDGAFIFTIFITMAIGFAGALFLGRNSGNGVPQDTNNPYREEEQGEMLKEMIQAQQAKKEQSGTSGKQDSE
jgi:hypothetical protein